MINIHDGKSWWTLWFNHFGNYCAANGKQSNAGISSPFFSIRMQFNGTTQTERKSHTEQQETRKSMGSNALSRISGRFVLSCIADAFDACNGRSRFRIEHRFRCAFVRRRCVCVSIADFLQLIHHLDSCQLRLIVAQKDVVRQNGKLFFNARAPMDETIDDKMNDKWRALHVRIETNDLARLLSHVQLHGKRKINCKNKTEIKMN